MSRDQSREAFETYFETLPLSSLGSDDEIDLAEGARVIDPAEAMASLPRIRVKREPAKLSADLEVIGVLGEGGMGVVQLARQAPLDRNVAVKTTKRAGDPAALHGLLQEAYVTGHLEHPNIIPIYTLGQDDGGAPLIVMKRVEGTSWLEVLRRGERELDYHLDVLRQVANAVRFAHSKGVIHRDIKPENVMIGDFGEVYLLDWGIAVSLRGPQGMMPPRESAGMAGTVAYMAPEMTEQTARGLDERTDVYLLGATLHEVITGAPPHQGRKLIDRMFSAYKSEPREYDESVPAELVEIVHRACHRDKEERFESAEAFGDALADFQHHRESVSISNEAQERLEQLLERLGEPEEGGEDAHIHDLFGECRFGFRQALRMWPENGAARAGLRAGLVAMAKYYVEGENLAAARSCLADLSDPPEGLVEEVDALARRLDEQQDELARLKRYEAQWDLRTAMVTRSITMVVIGVLWTLSTAVYIYSRQGLAEGAPFEFRDFAMTLRSWAIVIVPSLIFRRQLFANNANQRLMSCMYGLMASLTVVRFAMWQTESSLVAAQSADSVLYAFAAMAIGLMSDRRIAWLSSVFFAVVVGGAFWPALQLHMLAVAIMVFCLSMAWMWRPGQEDWMWRPGQKERDD